MLSPESYARLIKFAAHTCRCACGCRKVIMKGRGERCRYCKDGSCMNMCQKCNGAGYIWDNKKQKSKKCSCQRKKKRLGMAQIISRDGDVIETRSIDDPE